jgi:CheY-like chemotaxis protein/anti-sigma regulatory factor (Ser/Thr protein kinase)
VEGVMLVAKSKKVAVRSVLESDAWVGGDAIRLQQIFTNLLTNAVKFTPQGGKVNVRLRTIESNVIVSVRDTGEGIDGEFLQHIFERFRQADGSTARRHGGLGLGLAIAKQLAELHSGSIKAESKGPGRGSTFVVSLPAAARTAESTEGRAPILGDEMNLAGLRILCVDDDRDTQLALCRLLSEYKAHTDTASSSDEALRRLAELRPDVLISDIGMPGKDGYNLIREIRSAERDERLPAVALTAFARDEDRAHALDAGYDRHVPKPVQPRELLWAVTSVIRESASRRAGPGH